MLKNNIMDKSDFLKDGEFLKEEYEGLLVASDTEAGLYNIGLQLSEDKVLFLEQATDDEVHERYHQLGAQIADIQREYKVKWDLDSYSKS